MLTRPLTRVPPQGSAASYKTYEVRSPVSTHTRLATCQEVGCAHHRVGWRTVLDEATTRGRYHAQTVRNTCRPTSSQLAKPRHRRYTETREGELTVFTFGPGQRCFGEHRVPVGRPELFLVRGGDYRGNPRREPPRQHRRAVDWVEDFALHQQMLADRLGRG